MEITSKLRSDEMGRTDEEIKASVILHSGWMKLQMAMLFEAGLNIKYKEIAPPSQQGLTTDVETDKTRYFRFVQKIADLTEQIITEPKSKITALELEVKEDTEPCGKTLPGMESHIPMRRGCR